MSEVKKVIGVALMLVTGFWGFVITFSDVPSEWSSLRWAGYIAAWHIPSAMAIGYLFSPRWAWGVAAGWSALLMLLSYSAFAVGASVLAALVLASFVGGRLAAHFRRAR